MKPYAESCDENKLPILEILEREFSASRTILEIGSGTGQHAVFFGARLPHLRWQPSDDRRCLEGIRAWIDDAKPANVLAPIALNVRDDAWPGETFDGIFSANTAHIMSWPEVVLMFEGAGRVLNPGGVFCLYGPFNYNGSYTSPSNRSFDQWLKSRDPLSGIRDAEALHELAAENGLVTLNDHEMPANNRILVWKKTGAAVAGPARS